MKMLPFSESSLTALLQTDKLDVIIKDFKKQMLSHRYDHRIW